MTADDLEARAPHRAIYFGHPEPHVPGFEIDEQAPTPKLGRGHVLMLGVSAAIVAAVGQALQHRTAGAQVPAVAAGWMFPFVLLLLSIAAMPFIAPRWWEHNYARVAIALGVIVAAYYLLGLTETDAAGHRLGALAMAGSIAEYISFIYLIGSLFIVSGGILIRVRARATPLANVLMLLIGALLANVLGTTGASMLLIRPFLRMNSGHLQPYHVVFFIFIVSNAGGSLTPIGDPPLFLGYLKGVPFWWVLEHCWPIWLVVVGGLLTIFYVIDRVNDARTPVRDDNEGNERGPIVSLYGGSNLLFVSLIIAGILLHEPINRVLETSVGFALPIRELAMIVAAVGSLMATPPPVHAENHFNYAPIREVAILFLGIFLTMVPALNVLHHENSRPEAERRFMLQTPGQYYFASGSLSAVLDNAPTYLSFLQSQLGQLDATTDRVDALAADEHLNRNLVAISMGAVLFGAMTYIGNGPNFMVKSIASHAGVRMPGFFGYLFRFAVPVLLPLLIVVWLLFLR